MSEEVTFLPSLDLYLLSGQGQLLVEVPELYYTINKTCEQNRKSRFN